MKKEIGNGSDKQIKWANDIRKNLLNGLYYMKENSFNVDYTIERLEKATNAKWWIEKETGTGFGNVLPEIEYTNKKGETKKGNITGFFYHKSRDKYVPKTKEKTVLVFPTKTKECMADVLVTTENIISIKEKIKEEDK